MSAPRGTLVTMLANLGIPSVHDEDVRAVIEEMDRSVRYPSRDLYQAYAKVARDAGRQPGHPSAFGQALGRAPLTRCRVKRAGKVMHCWYL